MSGGLFTVRPNRFYKEQQVDIAVSADSQHKDFAKKRDELWHLSTGKESPYVNLSGSIKPEEDIEQGNYSLRGGYLRTFASGVNTEDALGVTPVASLYRLKDDYKIKEGGMEFARERLTTGTVAVTNGSTAVVGTNTNFSGTNGELVVGQKIWLGADTESKSQYKIASITSDTALTLTSNYTGTTDATTELEKNVDIGDGIAIYNMAYSNSINLSEDFDGTDAALSHNTVITREGPGVLKRKGNPYVEGSDFHAWKDYVRCRIGGLATQKKARELLQDEAFYPTKTDGQFSVYTQGQAANGVPVKPTGEVYGYVSDVTSGQHTGMDHGRLYLRKEQDTLESRSDYDAACNDNYRYKIVHPSPAGTTTAYHFRDTDLELLGVLKWDTEETFSVNEDVTVTSTENNTRFNKIYSTMDLYNPFIATSTVPVLQSATELSGDNVKSGANALRLYNLWDFSTDNAALEKYLGRDNTLNCQTCYASLYNIPLPLTQDITYARAGDHRTYLPYVGMSMNITKLAPAIQFGIDTYNTKFGTKGLIYEDMQGASDGYYDLNSNNFGSSVGNRNKVETFLRSVVITFSNYKPLDSHTSLDDFLDYGLTNAYGNAGGLGAANGDCIVGGVMFTKAGLGGNDDSDNAFCYAQALPVMKSSDYAGGFLNNAGIAKAVSGTAGNVWESTNAGRLQNLFIRPTDLNNAANDPRVVKVPMNQFVNMKFFIDVDAQRSNTSLSRNPYSEFDGGGVSMRAVFEFDTTQEGGSTNPDEDLPYIDLAFPGSPTGNQYAFKDFISVVGTLNDKLVYPKHMTIWVQNYRWTQADTTYFKNGDSSIVSTGVGTESEVYIDNVQLVDFYQNSANATATQNSSSVIQFPQGKTVKSPINKITATVGGTSYTLTSLNPGTGSTEFTDMATNYTEYVPASYLCFGFNNPTNLPISGSSTSRRGYFLMNGFSTVNFSGLDRIVPDLWGGGMVSLNGVGGGVGISTDNNQTYGYQFFGSSWASGSYSDVTTGSSMYGVVSTQDDTDKINITTGTNNYMAADGFTQKGAIMMSISGATPYGKWGKRENVVASTKIIDVAQNGNNLNNNQVVVADPDIINLYNEDDEYIIYRAGRLHGSAAIGGETFARTGLKLADGIRSVSANGTVTFDQDLSKAMSTTNVLGLCVEENISELYLSPYKYWVTLMTKGDQEFTARTIESATLLANNLSGATSSLSTITGTTYNETIYTYDAALQTTIGSSALYDNQWNYIFDPEEETAVILTNDYGYGAYNAETKTGGQVAKQTIRKSKNQYFDITNMVLEQDVQENASFNAMMRMPYSTVVNKIDFYGDEYAGTNSRQYKPTFIYEYEDLPPSVDDFIVKPAFELIDTDVNLYELTDENLNAVEFNWKEQAEDIWYRLLLINKEGSIQNKYTNVKLWVPMNEEPTTLTEAPAFTWYRPNNGSSGSAVVGGKVRSHVDGIQGFSPFLSGNALGTGTTGGSVAIPKASNDAFDGLSEYTFVTHVTFDSSMNNTACVVMSQGTAGNYIRLSKDSSNFIRYMHYSGAGSTEITGSSFVKCDGKTAHNIIVIYKHNSASGPDLQLYVNGRLEAYNSNTGDAITSNDNLEIGSYTYNGTGGFFKGRVEEVVLYDKKAYVPQKGNTYILNTADLDDVSSSKQNTWSGKLFLFDYHNIRGKTTRQVTATENASWRTTTI